MDDVAHCMNLIDLSIGIKPSRTVPYPIILTTMLHHESHDSHMVLVLIGYLNHSTQNVLQKCTRILKGKRWFWTAMMRY